MIINLALAVVLVVVVCMMLGIVDLPNESPRPKVSSNALREVQESALRTAEGHRESETITLRKLFPTRFA
jgi:hypothetical protein